MLDVSPDEIKLGHSGEAIVDNQECEKSRIVVCAQTRFHEAGHAVVVPFGVHRFIGCWCRFLFYC